VGPVDGVDTVDSAVFLFGARPVYTVLFFFFFLLLLAKVRCTNAM
jgi:hypothetical protein